MKTIGLLLECFFFRKKQNKKKQQKTLDHRGNNETVYMHELEINRKIYLYAE